MEQFKYQIYDYSKVGIPKKRIYIMQQYTIYEWDTLKKMLGGRLLTCLIDRYKEQFYESSVFHKISPNYELIIHFSTPDGNYETKIDKFDETSS